MPSTATAQKPREAHRDAAPLAQPARLRVGRASPAIITRATFPLAGSGGKKLSFSTGIRSFASRHHNPLMAPP